MKTKYLIVGAGPAGLGAAYRLKELGVHDFQVVDRAAAVGGLAASHLDPCGFTWDIGGHVQFSHYSYFDTVMDRALGNDGWLHHQRESWIWIHGRFVPYPLQQNIRYLPKPVRWKCLAGVIDLYQNATGARQPANFREWIVSRFGAGIAEEFLLPYNEKVWAHDLATMAYDWVGERVATADLMQIARNVFLDEDNICWGPNRTFRFPKRGGTGAIWEAVADGIGRDRIRLSAGMARVDAREKVATLDDGGTVRYERLLSTVPLDLFVAATDGLSPEVQASAARLKHSTVHVIGLGLAGEPPPEVRSKCWMYFPEGNCPFYRVTVFSNYSPNNVPPGPYWSLMAEISESGSKPVDRHRLAEAAIDGCAATRLIKSKEDVVSRWTYTAAYGYPIPCLERDSILQQVLPALEKLDISSRGRFGAWKYEVSNQDHTFMQGVEWVNRVELGIPETTMRYPNVANGGWGQG